MSINASAQQALDTRRAIVGTWLQIEGIPYAYGTWACGSALWDLVGNPAKHLGIRPSLLGIPKIVGQTIDTLKGGNLTSGSMRAEISDVDGEPIKWTNLVPVGGYQLAAPCSATTTAITLNYNAGLTIGQYLYVGTETWKVTAVGGGGTITVDREQFNSKGVALGYGFPVSTQPYCMSNRRVWMYQLFDGTKTAVGGFTQSGSTFLNAVLRFAGTLRSFQLKNGDPNTFVLSAESLDREIDREAFRTLRSFNAPQSIKDNAGVGGMMQVSGLPGFSAGWDTWYPATTGTKWTSSEFAMVRIDEEFFAVQVVAASPFQMKLLARGLLGTAIVAHKQGALVQEVVPVVGRNAPALVGQNQSWMELTSKFSSAPSTAAANVAADHPVILALNVLMSTGTGTNLVPGGVRVYDVLPDGWGLGIKYTRINIAQCEAAAREDPTLRFGGVIEDPINAVDFLRQLLTFAGYYFTIETGDLFTIRRLRPPLPDATTKTITQANRIRNNFTAWDANWKGAVRELVFKFGWDVVGGKYKRITVLRLGDADIYSKGVAQSLTFESKLLYPGGTGIPGEPPFAPFAVDEWLLHRRDFFEQRYGRPPPIIQERVDFSFLGTEVGELVLVNHPWLPNLLGARLNGSGIYGEVINKEVDDVSRTIELTILLTRYTTGQYRYFSPSFILHAGITINETSATEYELFDINTGNTGVPEDLGNDWEFTTPAGNVWNWADSAYVAVWPPDFSSYAVWEIQASGSGYLNIVFNSGVNLGVNAGDIVTLGSYEYQVNTDRSLFASHADVNTLDGADPHKLFPA